jgi:TonB-linked SusC/RagA family outer membrane protein
MKTKSQTALFLSIAVINTFMVFLCDSAGACASIHINTYQNTSGHYAPNVSNQPKTIISESRKRKIITGKVTDDKGGPLVGVSITERGTGNGTVTNSEGNYSLTVSKDDAVLVFTYIGYKQQSMEVSGKSIINVVMEDASKTLGEVVVTALGIKRETKKLGYAAEKVKIDEITTSRTTNMTNALEGKVAGLDITPPASGPGSSTKIRLRGQSSFNGDNSPLIVIDGLPMSQGANGANGQGQTTDQGDNMQGINPDDIESMTVLKGATAAALYGSRASNGAIIITTKTGTKKSGVGIELTSNYSIDQVLDYTDFQYEYGQGENNVRPHSIGEAQSSGAWSFGEKFDGAPTYQFNGQQLPYEPVKNRISEFFRLAQGMNNTLAIAGGGDKGNFRVSYSRQDAEGILPNNKFKKDIVHIGINFNPTSKLTGQLFANYDHELNTNPPLIGVQSNSAAGAMYRLANSIPLDILKDYAVDANGNETPTSRFSTLVNPYWIMEKQFTNQTKDHFTGTALLKYQILKWLSLQGRANMDFMTTLFEQNIPTGTRSSGPAPAGQFNGYYGVNTSTQRNMNFDFLLAGGHKWGDFTFDGTVGGNTFLASGNGFSESANNFYIRDLYTIGNGVTAGSSYGISKSTVNSLYATADFGYKSFLFLNLTGRNDWFSVLNPEHNHYFYPSVSGSFVFSELFSKLPSWLDFGRIRGSYAYVGSANSIGPYSNSLTFGMSQNLFNGLPIGYINNGAVPNADLKPYSIAEKELGLEVHMFKNRVNLDVAVYNKRTTNQILFIPLSLASGYSGSNFNLGSLQNKGLEFNLEVVPVTTPNFTWRTSFNSAFNTSKVLALAVGKEQLPLATGEFFGTLVAQVGLPLNQIKGADYDRDANGNVILTNGLPKASTQQKLFGSALPTATGGWTNTFKYKHASLLLHFDYKAGGKVLSSTNLNLLREGLSQASLVGREGGVVFPGVNPDGTPNTTAVNAETFYANYRSQNILTPFVYNSSFIKLRNISFSYDFSSMVKNTFIKRLAVSAYCRNVLIIKKFLPNLDPEAIQTSGDSLAGYEQASLPTTRTFGLNLDVKF